VEEQIKCEIENGRYKIVQDKPQVVSALGAIVKEGSDKVRLIHDGSRPDIGSLNHYAVNTPFSYQTLKDATSRINKGCFCAKLDLASAYRSVPLHQLDHRMAGLSWHFNGQQHPVYIQDQCLPFGARLSAAIFNTLTQAVRRIMSQQGYTNVVAYLDDFLLWADTEEECRRALNRLMSLVRELGFAINYNKVQTPTQRLTFLGVEIDTAKFTLSLPRDKLNQLQRELWGFVGKKSADKTQLQSLAGRLGWAAQVVHGGRTHTRRIIDKANTLYRQHHRTRITQAVLLDIYWWLDFLSIFNGTSPIVEYRAYTPVTIDACKRAAGGYYQGQWYNLQWKDWDETQDLHINMKEVLALEPAAQLWGHTWKDRLVTVYSDNRAAVSMINKGTSKCHIALSSLRNVFWLSAIHNFRIKAVYYPGKYNTIADRASRLQEYNGYAKLAAAIASSAGTSSTHPDYGYNPTTAGWGGGQDAGQCISHQHQEVILHPSQSIPNILQDAGGIPSTHLATAHMQIHSAPI
jgi:hypothetical protein